jgi:predicted phosphoribosyltransferase
MARHYRVARGGAVIALRTADALAADMADLLARTQLGDPAWERAWAACLAEKHARSRLPTLAELAHAFSYVEREFSLRDKKISGEMWAEGLALGQRSSVDLEDQWQAEDALEQLDAASWLQVTSRANALAREHGEPERYLR